MGLELDYRKRPLSLNPATRDSIDTVQPCSFPSTAATARGNRRRSNGFASGCASRATRWWPAAIRAARRLGEAVRGLLLDRHDLHIDRRGEMFLYMAARSQMVEEVIRPALAAGKTVVSDRYLLANVVYQGHAGGLDVATLWQVGRVATGGLMPELTIVLDTAAEVAAARMARPLDRMEQQGAAFHARVRQGFLAEAAQLAGGDRRRRRNRLGR